MMRNHDGFSKTEVKFFGYYLRMIVLFTSSTKKTKFMPRRDSLNACDNAMLTNCV